MYKKITHNIVEEHFNHPVAATIKKTVDNKKVPKQKMEDGTYDILTVDGSLGLHDPLPWDVYNDNTMTFRMDARSAWMKWAFSLINYSIALNAGLMNTDQVKGRVHKNAMALGDFIVPYYGLSAGNLLSTSLIALNDVGMHYILALKDKKPTDDIAKEWEPYVADIAKLLNELNPNNWPKTLVQDMFTNLVNGWKNELDARDKGDITADELAIEYLDKLIVSGVADHRKAGFTSISDNFSRGIIAQFPTMFTE
jgi:hypothetical protein